MIIKLISTSKLLEHLKSRIATASNPPTAGTRAFFRLYPSTNVVCPPHFSDFLPFPRPRPRPREPEDHHKADCIGLEAPGAMVTMSNDSNWHSTNNRGMSSTSILPSPAHPFFPLPSFHHLGTPRRKVSDATATTATEYLLKISLEQRENIEFLLSDEESELKSFIKRGKLHPRHWCWMRGEACTKKRENTERPASYHG